MSIAPSVTVRTVFVAWQQPQTRAYHPVARLIASAESDGGYEFVYIKGALDAVRHGFQPFLAFPDLNQVYRSQSLFPFFSNRLMSRNRPDFPEHLDRLGLPPDADDMAILARSAGARMTDSLELFPLPVPDPARCGGFQTHFWMHGYRYLKPEEQARALRLQPGEPLEARRQISNPADPNAICLFTRDEVFVGWAPRYLAADACNLLSECAVLDVFVERVNPEPAPSQQRLLCALQSCWPSGFVPCDTEVYRPVPAEAWVVDSC